MGARAAQQRRSQGEPELLRATGGWQKAVAPSPPTACNLPPTGREVTQAEPGSKCQRPRSGTQTGIKNSLDEQRGPLDFVLLTQRILECRFSRLHSGISVGKRDTPS